jgi:CDP-diacylglycerol--serine O-phosphatidyltransferase
MNTLFPPFDPEQPERRRKRFQSVPLRFLFPNIVTLVALCAGLTAVRLSIEGRLDLAIYAIVFAAMLDGIDGRIARLLKGTSRFGAELDSLADFVNFGCAPGLILYFWGLHELKTVGWICCLVFTIAMVLRLARFNVSLDAPDQAEWRKSFGVGVPAPAGALCALLPIYLSLIGLSPTLSLEVIAAVYLVGIALLMVSRVPTFLGKKAGLRVRRELVLPLFAAVVLFFALLFSNPFETLTALVVLYLGTIPVSLSRYRRLERQAGDGHGEQEGGATPV